jgi:hypothetical protein
MQRTWSSGPGGTFGYHFTWQKSEPTALAISYSFLFTFVTEKQREIIQGNAHSIDLGRPPA